MWSSLTNLSIAWACELEAVVTFLAVSFLPSARPRGCSSMYVWHLMQNVLATSFMLPQWTTTS